MLSFLTWRKFASVHFGVEDHAFVALEHRVVAGAVKMIESKNDVAETGQFLHYDGIHASVPAKTVAEENWGHFLFAVGEYVRQLDANFSLGVDFSPRPENKRTSLWLIFVPSYSCT